VIRVKHSGESAKALQRRRGLS